MTNRDYQRSLEKHHITPIINHLNISWDNVEIGDEPDVIIRNYKGKDIGVENIEYHSTQHIQETDVKLNKICKKYEGILKERGEVGFMLHVNFSDDVYSVKRLDDQKVLEDIEYSRDRQDGKRFVWYSMRLNMQMDDVKVFRLVSKIFSGEINYSIVKKLIERKEEKLTSYKRLEKNKSIDEYWLNINIPLNEGVIYKPEDTLSVESDYKRIYLSTFELGDTPLRLK